MPHSPRQLEQWFQDLEDGCISAEDLQRLTDLFLNDPEVRRRYCEHAVFCSALHTEALVRVELGQWQPKSEAPSTPGRIFRRSLLAAAALLALLAGLGSIFRVKAPEPVIIVEENATVWQFKSGGLDDQDQFLPGSSLLVEQGHLQLTLSSGTMLLLEAPTEIEMLEGGHVRIDHGALWAVVPRKDRGFTVATGRFQVTDLGTEFGIAITSQSEEVHVGLGKVRVQPGIGSIAPVELHEGQAVAIDAAGRSRAIPFRPDRFKRTLPASSVILVRDGYQNAYGDFSGLAIDFDASAGLDVEWSPALSAGREYSVDSVTLFDGGSVLDEEFYLGVYTSLDHRDATLDGFLGVSDNTVNLGKRPTHGSLTWTFSDLTVVPEENPGSGNDVLYFVLQTGTTSLVNPPAYGETPFVQRIDGEDGDFASKLGAVIDGRSSVNLLKRTRTPEFAARLTSLDAGP